MLDALKVFLETNGNKIYKRTKKEEQGLTAQSRLLLRIGEKDVGKLKCGRAEMDDASKAFTTAADEPVFLKVFT